jgi:DNA-binding NtrC family response regulator
MHRILLALDPATALMARSALERDGHAVVTAPPDSIFDAILRDDFDLVIADLECTDLSAIAFSRRVDVSGSFAEFLLAVSPSATTSGLIGMNQGAFDFVTLPLDVEHLRLKALRALERRRLRAELRAARTLLRERFSPVRWLDLPASARLRSDVEAILPGRAPVLLVGEPGTETAALAHLIHLWGHRASGPFVPVPGSIFPARELEAALRGVARSEGSGHRRPGWLERAHGGTLFFEEIARIPLEIQEWLVSVIDGGPVLPIGAAAGISPDVRILFAIHQSPDVAAVNQRLAPALFERLRRNAIQVPPLRDRREEIPGLVQEVLDSCGLENLGVTSSALRWLEEQRWPGNRMELEGTLLRALLERRSPDRISLADLVPGAEDTSDAVRLRAHPGARGEPDAFGEPGARGEPDAFDEPGARGEPDAFDEPGARGEPDAFDESGTSGQGPAREKAYDNDARLHSPHQVAPPAPNGTNGRSWTEAVERARRMENADRSRVESLERAPHMTQPHYASGVEEEHGSLHLPEHGVDLVLLERQLIEEALDRTGGNQTHAARLLGLTRQTLIYRMQKYGIR